MSTLKAGLSIAWSSFDISQAYSIPLSRSQVKFVSAASVAARHAQRSLPGSQADLPVAVLSLDGNDQTLLCGGHLLRFHQYFQCSRLNLKAATIVVADSRNSTTFARPPVGTRCLQWCFGWTCVHGQGSGCRSTEISPCSYNLCVDPFSLQMQAVSWLPRDFLSLHFGKPSRPVDAKISGMIKRDWNREVIYQGPCVALSTYTMECVALLE